MVFLFWVDVELTDRLISDGSVTWEPSFCFVGIGIWGLVRVLVLYRSYRFIADVVSVSQ